MPVDVSMYPQAQPPPNMLTQMSNMAGLVGQMNQNKLFQQQFAAKQAFGNAISANTDKTTGVTNWDAVSAQISHDPRANYLLGEFQQQQLARQQTQLQMQSTQQELADKYRANANSVLGSLLGNKKATSADAVSAIADLYRTGNIDPKYAMDTINEIQGTAGDDAKFQDFLKQRQLQGLPAGERQAAIYGTPQNIDTGGSIVPVTVTPMTGQVNPMTVQGPNGPQIGFQKTLSPGEAAPYSMMTKEQLAQPIEWFDPAKNQKVSGTMAQYLQATGMAGGKQGPAGAPTAPAGPVAAGPALGAEAAASEAGRGSAEAWNALHADVANSGARVFSLQKALGALQNTATGPGTEGRNQIVSFLAAAPGIKNIVPDFAVDKVKSYDEANKYLQQYAMGQASGLGAGTDEKLSTALTANASTHISNLAAQDVVKANIGLERYKQAQAQAFDASGKPPQDFSKWQAEWNKQVDPRAFVADQLNADQMKAMIKGMNPAEKSKFVQTHQWAKQNGLIQ